MIAHSGGRSPEVTGLPRVDNNTDFPPLTSSNSGKEILDTTLSSNTKLNFMNTIKQCEAKVECVEAIPRKPVQLIDGFPRIKWTEAEVCCMNIIENLQYVVISKFSYGWPDLDIPRNVIPLQCGIKGDCTIGLFQNRHMLIRLSSMEDYVNIISKGSFYITCNEGY